MKFKHQRDQALIYAVLLAAVLPGSPSVQAAGKADVCVKYQKEYGWSKGYSVEGTIISGMDLNSKVGSISRFKAFSTYVVIFWDKEQATILELSPMAMGRVPIFESDASDQEGRKWRIKEGHSFCF